MAPDEPALVQLGRVGYPKSLPLLAAGMARAGVVGERSLDPGRSFLSFLSLGSERRRAHSSGGRLAEGKIHARFALNGHVLETDFKPGTTGTVTLLLPPENEAYDPDMQITFRSSAIIPMLPPKPNHYPKRGMRSVGLGLIAIRYVQLPKLVGPVVAVCSGSVP